MSLTEGFNRIYVRQIGFEYEDGNRRFIDTSGFGFLVEELISYGVVDVAVDHSLAPLINILPEGLKKRVFAIKKSSNCYKQADAFFSPITEEYKLSGYQGGINGRKLIALPPELAKAIHRAYHESQAFIMGMFNRLQIDINLSPFKAAVEYLRKNSRSPESRANLSILAGIIESYKNLVFDTIEIRSIAPKQLYSKIESFIEDETYRKFSEHVHSIGYPAKLRRSLVLSQRTAKKLLLKPCFKEITNLTSKIISAIVKVPLPNADTGITLMGNDYFPTIISMKEIAKKAKENWHNVPYETRKELFPGSVIIELTNGKKDK